MPRRGNSQSPMKAPRRPTMRSPINPNPPPVMTLPASHPARMPTMIMTNRPWLETYIVDAPDLSAGAIFCSSELPIKRSSLIGRSLSAPPRLSCSGLASGATRPAAPQGSLPVRFAFLRQPLDRSNALAFGGREHDDALGRTAGDPDAVHRAADELAAVGNQHDLVAFLDRERGDETAVLLGDRHGDDAFAAAAGGAVFVG